MRAHDSLPPPEPSFRQVLRERTLWLLIACVLLIYLPRIDALTVRHEEPRRGRIATEMLETGDWIVPRQQGRPLLSRPPLQNWAIAGLATLRGRTDAVAIRLPSAIAILATAILIHLYARRFLGPLGALAGGAGYATMAQVLELGTRGETEALITFWISGSLLIWHGAASRGPVSWRSWIAAYLLVALGVLTKGPQAPIYFGGTVALYLLWRGRWRELVRPAHLAGILVGAGVVAAWLIPFRNALGTEAPRKIFFGDVGLRFRDTSPSTIVLNLASYPLEVWAAALPWSLLLVAYLNREHLRGLGRFADAALFLAIALAVSFPTCWLPPGSHTRYFMPLYPCLAILAGAVVERAADAGDALARKLWSAFRMLVAALVALVALGLALGKLTGRPEAVAGESAGFVVAFVGIALAAIVYLARSSRRFGRREALGGVLVATAMCGICFSGVLTNVWVRSQTDVRSQVTALGAKLPDDVELFSLGSCDPVFTHYWEKPIRRTPFDATGAGLPPDLDYFCFSPQFTGRTVESLAFRWEQIDRITCDYNRRDPPRRPLYVGRVAR